VAGLLPIVEARPQKKATTTSIALPTDPEPRPLPPGEVAKQRQVGRALRRGRAPRKINCEHGTVVVATTADIGGVPPGPAGANIPILAEPSSDGNLVIDANGEIVPHPVDEAIFNGMRNRVKTQLSTTYTSISPGAWHLNINGTLWDQFHTTNVREQRARNHQHAGDGFTEEPAIWIDEVRWTTMRSYMSPNTVQYRMQDWVAVQPPTWWTIDAITTTNNTVAQQYYAWDVNWTTGTTQGPFIEWRIPNPGYKGFRPNDVPFIRKYEDGDVWDAWNKNVFVTQVEGEQYQVAYEVIADNSWDAWVAVDEEHRVQREIARRQIENELQARRERENARLAEMERQKKVKAEAEERALAILLFHLDAEQRIDYLSKGQFFLIAKSGRKYRLTKGTHGNVFMHENGRDVERFCIQPNMHGLPLNDVVLSQVLMLRTNEEEFRKIANISNLRDYRRPNEVAPAVPGVIIQAA